MATTKKKTFGKWLRDSGYHANFFIGVCSGIATYVALKAEGLHIFTSLGAFISWALFLLFFLAIYFFGAFLLYKGPFK